MLEELEVTTTMSMNSSIICPTHWSYWKLKINSTHCTALFYVITRETHVCVPCHRAGSSLWTTCKCCMGWVAAASPNLAAFQTSVEEDEGSLPRLSRRESKGLTQPTSVEGDEGRGKRGWSEPPTRRLEMAGGGVRQTRHSKAFVGAICFTIRYYFQSDGRAWFAVYTWFPSIDDYTQVWLTFSIIPFDASSVLLFL